MVALQYGISQVFFQTFVTKNLGPEMEKYIDLPVEEAVKVVGAGRVLKLKERNI